MQHRLAPNVHVVRGDMDEGPTAGMNAATPYPEHKVGRSGISFLVCTWLVGTRLLVGKSVHAPD